MFISVYQIWTSKYTECLDYFRIVGCRLWNLQVIKSTKHINIDENMERKKASSQITMKKKGSSESTRGPSLVLTNCPVSVYNIMPAWSSLPPPCDDICLFCTNFLSSAHYIFHLFLPLCVCFWIHTNVTMFHAFHLFKERSWSSIYCAAVQFVSRGN